MKPAPVSPFGPFSPGSPLSPFAPGEPAAPGVPVSPLSPLSPFSPFAPAGPVSPLSPFAPVSPLTVSTVKSNVLPSESVMVYVNAAPLCDFFVIAVMLAPAGPATEPRSASVPSVSVSTRWPASVTSAARIPREIRPPTLIVIFGISALIFAPYSTRARFSRASVVLPLCVNRMS